MVLAEEDEDNVTDLLTYVDSGLLHKKAFEFEELTEIQSYKLQNA